MTNRKKSPNAGVGFPLISWDEEEPDTRPMPLHERPLQARVDVQLAFIAERHARIAHAIETFWGHSDCLDYIQNLVLSGYKEDEKRMGFKPEIVTALMNLVELHKQAFGK